ncbi:MAG: hypothetical protein V2I57_09515 [Xanthomonadales bacterium]|jgi:hypothetical protein|nr:hypothetical protein [Xanthomonadales bacterium]
MDSEIFPLNELATALLLAVIFLLAVAPNRILLNARRCPPRPLCLAIAAASATIGAWFGYVVVYIDLNIEESLKALLGLLVFFTLSIRLLELYRLQDPQIPLKEEQ